MSEPLAGTLTLEMFDAFTKQVLAEALEPPRRCPHLVSQTHAERGGWGLCSMCLNPVLIENGRVVWSL